MDIDDDSVNTESNSTSTVNSSAQPPVPQTEASTQGNLQFILF